MVRSRRALLRTVQQFFELELVGLYRWGSGTEIMPAEPNTERDPDRPLRTRTFGKDREAVTVRFGTYTLLVRSPNDDPPLGGVTLHTGESTIDGPLDSETWKRAGELVRQTESQNVDRRSEQRAERPQRVDGRSDPIPGWGRADI